jgi:hypothetical protein
MNIRSVATIAVAVLGMSASTAVYAAPTAIVTPLHAMFEKSKMVKLSLRNDTDAPMELKVGEDVMTIAAGKTVAVKLAIGTRIVTNAATAGHASGALLAEVSPALSDATIGIK